MDDDRDRTEELPASGRAVWFGVLGGVVAWALHLGGSYALVPYVCGTTQEFVLHLLTVGLAAVALLATAVAWRAHRRLAREPAGPERTAVDRAARVGRQDFLAVSGVLLSAFFLALILAEGLPALLLEDPCADVPGLDRPIILAPDGAGLAGLVPGPDRAAALGAGVPDPGRLVALAAAGLHDATGPGPGEAWRAWNLDPWVLLLLAVAGGLYARGVARLWRRAGPGRGVRRWQAAAYAGGIAALVAALISPVAAVAGALLSVHMVQHLLLMVVAAPLLVLGRPAVALVWALPGGPRRRLTAAWRRRTGLRAGWRGLSHPATVFVLHVAALWIWHVPALYDAALATAWIHHLQHATFFGAAMLFWWVLADSGAGGRLPGYGAAVLYTFATLLQGGALGALITFARLPWYAGHIPGAELWGVDPLRDQQLAGVLMWVPAGLVYAAAAVLLFVAWLGHAERRVRLRERARAMHGAPGRAVDGAPERPAAGDSGPAVDGAPDRPADRERAITRDPARRGAG